MKDPEVLVVHHRLMVMMDAVYAVTTSQLLSSLKLLLAHSAYWMSREV